MAGQPLVNLSSVFLLLRIEAWDVCRFVWHF